MSVWMVVVGCLGFSVGVIFGLAASEAILDLARSKMRSARLALDEANSAYDRALDKWEQIHAELDRMGV